MLDKDRVYEVEGTVIRPATEAIAETETTAEMYMFGEAREFGVKPIEDCCKVCTFWQGKFKSTQECQASQKEDAEVRGFKRLICPEQLREAKDA